MWWVPIALLSLLAVSYAAEPPLSHPQRGFVSRHPAQNWEEALISGNGTMGAMVFGQPREETVILTHGRLYLPLNAPLPPPNQGARLAEIRQLMAEGKYQQAADRVVEISTGEGYGGKRWTDPFVPAVDLKVTMESGSDRRDYLRSTDFETAEAKVAWRDARSVHTRRLFVSRKDNVVVYEIRNDRKGGINCELELATRPREGAGGWWPVELFRDGVASIESSATGDSLAYRSLFKRSWPGSIAGYEGYARVIQTGGTKVAAGSRLHILGADRVLVLLRIDLLNDPASSNLSQLRASLRALPAIYDRLLAPHRKLHQEIFGRVRLELDNTQNRLPSEDLIASSRVGRLSPSLVERVFDASRYAVVCSSGDVFPNLQGIWNGTWGPPWSADFTQNGNVQTAIAGNLNGNMPELLLPYFNYLESQLDDSRQNAKRLFGTRGIHIASRTSTHGLNNHFDATWPMTFWTAGAAWAGRFYYDYFRFTGDRKFLRERAVPFMKEAALFYEDFLIKGPDGKWLFSPSYSPENNPGNSPSQACINATMDIAAAKELLTNLIAACEELKIEKDGVARWKAMLADMPDYQIGPDGAVKEWTTPLLTDNNAHRHASHLYPLFYGLPDDIAARPDWIAGFRKAIDNRIAFRRKEETGEMAFGAVQVGQAAASLGDAAVCYEVLDWLTNLYWSPALTSTHNAKSLFNTDICGGLPDLVIRMLVDSTPGTLSLLPALPRQFDRGRIQGVLARGGVTVKDLQWDLGKRTVTVELVSKQPQTLRLRVPHGDGVDAGRDVDLERIRLDPGVPRRIEISFQSFG